MSNIDSTVIKIGRSVTYYGCRDCILEGFIESFSNDVYVVIDKVSNLRYHMKRSEFFLTDS